MSVTIRGSGQVPVQIVQATSIAQLNTSSASYVATPLTATITPTNSANKILVSITGNLYGTMYGTIYRNGTDIGNANTYGFIRTNTSFIDTTSTQYLDSPATTSATTYTVYVKSASGSVWWNIDMQTCTIILQEISYA